ncbi:hypothetical protein GCM10009841_28610 [Microlunatus panaciterrae]|uniref:Serine/threonine protein phosphatase PrpC n=1 Tax=Microlunatus panaciterrae TaxID=400768 RepID=A0ABS2RH55_9ACTN|nr:protein phosphatase 2C domain-containing protein [Microlunatus panaciterrae]MBM7797521.1 serine/threonine protein phosphatase PrpC [Microlunatus panaciterrae]
MTSAQTPTPLRCPTCGAEVAAVDSFCESCGSELTPSADPPTPAADETPISLSRPVTPEAPTDPPAAARPCAECGGVVGADGYCETCGTRAPRERDHYTELPADWVAAVSDRGVRHHRNEDASAIAADAEPNSRAVLVVCDGVSTSQDSDVASLAAARRARDVLVSLRPAGIGPVASRVGALASAIRSAAAQANTAVVDNSTADADSTASCTFVAAVLEGDLIVYGNVGDSRAYWIPDLGGTERAQQLTQDDSVAQVRIESGVARSEAENGPQAHAITKWLGRDSPGFEPRTGSLTVNADGWLLVCSDGLWNYASEADALQQLVGELSPGQPGPAALAQALVDWACEQGGKDNITVALARHTAVAGSQG